LVFTTSLGRISTMAQLAVPNDNFTNSIRLEGTNITVAGNGANATLEKGEPTLDPTYSAKTVWYSWVAPFTSRASFMTFPPMLGESVSVFTGPTLDHLQRHPRVQYAENAFVGIEGTIYHIQAGLPRFNTGRIELAERKADGILVWSLTGEAGYRYLIEKNSGNSTWKPLMVITNSARSVTFTDPSPAESTVDFTDREFSTKGSKSPQWFSSRSRDESEGPLSPSTFASFAQDPRLRFVSAVRRLSASAFCRFTQPKRSTLRSVVKLLSNRHFAASRKSSGLLYSTDF